MLEKLKSFLLVNTSTRQTVAKNAFWLTVSNFGGRFLRAIIIIYAARVLGAAPWGVFSYAITLVAFLTIFIDLGISSILMRDTARAADHTERAKVVATSFALKLILLALGVLVVLFVAPHFTTIEQAKALFPIVALILIFDSVREFGFSFTRAIERMEIEAFLYILTNIAIVGAGFVTLYLHPTVKAFTYAYAIGTGFGMFATLAVLRRNFKGIFNYFTAKLIKPILASAWPFAISGVLGTLLVNTDILIIGALGTATDVGHYSAALRIIQLLYLIPVVLGVSTLPTFARLATRNQGKMRDAVERTISLMFLVAIPLAVGGLIVGRQVIVALFGGEYAPGAPSFQVLALTLVIDFSALIISNAVFAYDKQRLLIIYAAIGGVLNVIFDLILIPRYGIVGSAWATFAAQLISNIYLWRTLQHIVPFRILPHLRKMIPAGIIMAGAVWLLAHFGIHVFIIIPLAATLYAGVLYFLREPLLNEAMLVLKPGAEVSGQAG